MEEDHEGTPYSSPPTGINFKKWTQVRPKLSHALGEQRTTFTHASARLFVCLYVCMYVNVTWFSL